MKPNWKYVLLEYDYISVCQGTEDHNHTLALIHCPDHLVTLEVLFLIKDMMKIIIELILIV